MKLSVSISSEKSLKKEEEQNMILKQRRCVRLESIVQKEGSLTIVLKLFTVVPRQPTIATSQKPQYEAESQSKIPNYASQPKVPIINPAFMSQ
jgi:hypothetical protein